MTIPKVFLLLTLSVFGVKNDQIFDYQIDNEIDALDDDNLRRVQIIYPGTKWCGPGNIASNYDDLGYFTKTDMCCRTHDHCDNIAAGESKDGLVNNTPFTK